MHLGPPGGPNGMTLARATDFVTASCQPPTSGGSGRRFRRVLVLVPPVPGPIVEAFHYEGSPFQRGLHRGVDLRAAPGDRVVATCQGVVAWADPQGVTLMCERRRVTLLTLTSVVVRTGQRARPGDDVGRAATNELHLGVRHANDPFGYVDPAPLLRRHTPTLPLTGPRAWRAPRVPRVRAVPRSAPAPGPSLAPWTAWAGLALMLAGGTARVRIRRRRAATARAVASSPPWPSM